MAAEPERESIVQIHHRGERGVDGILRLIELAAHDGPLEAMLSAMCDEIAAIAGVEIASIYVREAIADSDRLVMRGNHGFPASAIGATSLAIGEGITGLVAECMRPISAAHASPETSYKHVPGLGEERYPVFVGVPLIGAGSTIGVLVLQRRTTPFETREVTLATALGAPVTLAVERRRATASRSARLSGVAQVGGAVLGRAALIPTVNMTRVATFPEPPESASASWSSNMAPAELAANDSVADTAAGDSTQIAVERAYARLRDDLGRAVKRLAHAMDPATGGALDRFALALHDARLRERIDACWSQPNGLRSVAREYARASQRVGSHSHGVDRSTEIAELCALLGDTKTPHPGAIWIGDRVDSVMAIAAVARGAAALVACDFVSAAAIAIARAAGLPVVSDVAALFDWARANDLLAVDGDRGVVLVHPGPSEIERLRRERR